ncbi:MAG: transcription-repair coupling factor, partial [Gammaproteobacteria bacterium]|nr:transcription-repair coupling factor [Gammaproteobacteria bacterium]
MSDKTMTSLVNPLSPPVPKGPGDRLFFGSLYGSSSALVIAELAKKNTSPTVALTANTSKALELEAELRFYLKDSGLPILSFPDWETLPYDIFSPHQDIISQRLETLYLLPRIQQGLLILPIATAMQRIAPKAYVEGNSLLLKQGDVLDLDAMRLELESNGYRCVSQVMDHGEFAVRGSLLDLYPSGTKLPYRIDLFDNEVDSIRRFNPETQITDERVDEVRVLPAREFPMNEEAIKHFRGAYRDTIEGDPTRSIIYKDISDGNLPGGIEYYLPLFFSHTETLFDYLPESTLFVSTEEAIKEADVFYDDLQQRYESRRYNIERPILPPLTLYLNPNQLSENLKPFPVVHAQSFSWDEARTEKSNYFNFVSKRPPSLVFDSRRENSVEALELFLKEFHGRILFVVESEGRREVLLEILRNHRISPKPEDSWLGFLKNETKLGICISPIDTGIVLNNPDISVITENQLFGQRVKQQRRRVKT